MITVEVHQPQGKRWDRRGLLFDATALYGDLRFEVAAVHSPVVAALRAVIAWAPDFEDCRWQLVRGGVVALHGGSARKMAGVRFVEGDRSIRAYPEDWHKQAIYAPSPVSVGEGA